MIEERVDVEAAGRVAAHRRHAALRHGGLAFLGQYEVQEQLRRDRMRRVLDDQRETREGRCVVRRERRPRFGLSSIQASAWEPMMLMAMTFSPETTVSFMLPELA